MDSLQSLKMSPKVQSAVQRATTRRMTPEDLLEQKVSYVYGMLDSANTLTRDQVREMLLEQTGVGASTPK
jgi:hypothetical protein